MTILNRTINYTQNVPINLGYNNPFSGTGTFNVEIIFPIKMGKFETSEIGGVNSSLFSSSTVDYYRWSVSGTAGVVNQHLNALTWTPASYESGTVQYNFLSLDRQINPDQCEAMFTVPFNPSFSGSANSIAVGQRFTLSDSAWSTNDRNFMNLHIFEITKIMNFPNTSINVNIVSSDNKKRVIYARLVQPVSGELCNFQPVFDLIILGKTDMRITTPEGLSITNPTIYGADFADYRPLHQGEVMFNYGGAPISGLVIGSNILLNDEVEFVVTRIENTRSQNRIFAILLRPYEKGISASVPAYDNVVLYQSTIRAAFGSDLTPRVLIDYTVGNPYGNFTSPYGIRLNGNIVNTGNITFNGSPLIQEPSFTTFPAQSFVCGPGILQNIPLGQVQQSQGQFISVQLLMKRGVNDPDFDGSVANNRPSYIKDNSYGTFTTVFVGERQSESYETGEVRWSFFGTPSQCNTALSQVRYILPPNPSTPGQPAPSPKDFILETRIVEASSRIHFTRGYD